MKKKSIYGLKPSQLGRLLSVSACVPESVSDMPEDQVKEVAFRDRLNRRMSDDPSFVEALVSVGGEPARRGPGSLDRSLREALLDPECSMPLLQAIKDHSKRLSAMVTSGSETLVTTTIYYAAIAAALVHHGQRITKYSSENLAERFSLLAQRAWIDGDVRWLFAQAAEVCRKKEKGADGQ
jgi:hypothetical protein